MADTPAPRFSLAPIIRDARGERVRVLEAGEIAARLQTDRDSSGAARRRITQRMWSRQAVQHWLPTYIASFAALLILAIGLPLLLAAIAGSISGYVMGFAIVLGPALAAPVLLVIFSRKLASMRAWAIVGEGFCARCGYPLADLEGERESRTDGREREIITCPECGAAWEVAPEPAVSVSRAGSGAP